MNVVCNKDLFLYIQQFINGEEGLVRNFRLKFGNNVSILEVLKKALVVTNWRVVESIYHMNQKHINRDILVEWKNRRSNYPHRVYGMLSTCNWLNEKMGNDFRY